MKLEISQALRIFKDKNGKTRYVFLCKVCKREIFVIFRNLKSHKGLCQSCGAKRATLVKNQTIYPPFKKAFNLLRKNRRGCVLTFEEFLEFTKVPCCRYCDAFIPWDPRGTVSNLDRKENTLG